MAEYRAIEELPSVEPKHTKKRTETHACDLISRQAVTDTVRKIILGFFSDEDGVMTDTEKTLMRVNKAICNGVRELPSAQPERMRGKWIERNPQNSDKCRLIECDQCGFSHIVGFNVPYEHWIENRNFCERCGADMRGEQDGRFNQPTGGN